MRERLRQLFLLVLGWGVLLLGVVGLFLPILQGVLLILVGMGILSKVSPRMRRLRDRLHARYPGPFLKAEEIGHRTTQFFRRLLARITPKRS